MPDQSRNPHNLIAGALGVVVIIAIGTYMYTHPSSPAVSDMNTTSTPITTDAGDVSVTTSGGSATVTEVPVQQRPQAPDFRTALTFSDAVSADVRTALTAQFDATVKVLEGNKLSFNAWINLGTLRKMTGDYAGAKTVWAYVAKLYPKSTVPFDNLGELYLDYLKDYPKAEANFKQAITNDSHDINAYQQLVSLYTIYGYLPAQAGKDKALTLIQKGIAANPNNQTLLELQSQLQAQ